MPAIITEQLIEAVPAQMANEFRVVGLTFGQYRNDSPFCRIAWEKWNSDGDGTLITSGEFHVPVEVIGANGQLFAAVEAACYGVLQAEGVFPK